MGAVCVSGTWANVGYQTAILLVTAVASGPAGVQGFHRDANLVALGPSPRIVDARLPANLVVPDRLRPLVTTMWRNSATFRRQCGRLGENPAVVVHIELVARTRHGRARSRVERHDGGVHASVQIELRAPQMYVEHIAHELEHVLEYVDGTDVSRFARQGLDGVMDIEGQYETARARSVGRTVAREAIVQLTETESARRITPGLGMWATAGLVILGGREVQADDVANQLARLAAPQRIRADAASTLKPAALSHDGRLIAFVARDRDSLERQCCLNVYVLDTSTGLITQESVSPEGTPSRGDSQTPSLSSDGRVIAFETMASNLPSGEATHVRLHIIVRERQDGALRTPLSASGDVPNGLTSDPVVSGDGRAVAFTSDASNLTPGEDVNGQQTDVYFWRLDSSTVTRLSVDDRGVQPTSGASHSPSVSRDGELVAFVSTARLVPDDTNNMADVYLRDVRRGVTSLVSRGVDGSPADGASHSPALSANGRYVAFASTAANLGARDRNRENDVYIHDVTAGTTTLVSATSKGEAANAASRRPAISADGRYVVYQSVGSNVGSGPGCPPPASDTNLLPDVYLFDRITLCATRISGSPTQEWWTPSVAPAIDGAGRIIVFSSTQPVDHGEGTVDFDLFQSSTKAQRP